MVLQQQILDPEETPVAAVMSPSLSMSELASRHPIVSILYSRRDEPGAYDTTALQDFLDYETNNGAKKVVPFNLTDFYSDYINFSVIRYLSQHRGQYGPRHFRFNIRDVLDCLSKLAYLNVVRRMKITEAMVQKVLPPIEMTNFAAKPTRDEIKNLLQPDFEFRTFGILEKVEETNKKFSYVFRELCVRDYLVSLFIYNECHRKIKAGKKTYHVISSTMRESMKRLPDTSDIWRIAFGMLSDEPNTKESQKHVLRELIEEAKVLPELTPFDTTNLCVEAIYESQNAGELTELLDDFSLNQTIRYSDEYLKPARLQYAVTAVGYLVRASHNVYGVHMAHFGLNAKSIGMLADPVNDVSDNNLQVLNLSQNPLGPSGMKGLLRFLVKATLLSHLDLGSCELGNVGIALLSEFFMCMPLRYLRLSDNNLGDAGVKRMFRNVKYAPTLEWLDMSDNNITDKGAVLIGKALPYLPNLRSLDIQRNNIGDDGVEAISSNLAKLNQVTQLMLGENKIGSAGATKLSAHVWKSKSMRFVNLNLNNIPAEGIMGLKKAAEEHGHLKISVSNQSQRSAGDISLNSTGEGEMVLPYDETQDRHKFKEPSTGSSVNLLEGRNADFDRGRPLRRSWSGRSSFRRSWHDVSGNFRRGEAI